MNSNLKMDSNDEFSDIFTFILPHFRGDDIFILELLYSVDKDNLMCKAIIWDFHGQILTIINDETKIVRLMDEPLHDGDWGVLNKQIEGDWDMIIAYDKILKAYRDATSHQGSQISMH